MNHATTTHNYTLSLHDALPICLEPLAHALGGEVRQREVAHAAGLDEPVEGADLIGDRHGLVVEVQVVQVDDESVDRKSTRLNSSHVASTYAVFCLKKKKNKR